MKTKFKKQDPPLSKLPKFMPGDIVRFEIESTEETVYAVVEFVKIYRKVANYNLVGWHTQFPESRLTLIEKKEDRRFVVYPNHE